MVSSGKSGRQGRREGGDGGLWNELLVRLEDRGAGPRRRGGAVGQANFGFGFFQPLYASVSSSAKSG